jgi:hypothetical protein
MEGNPPSNVLEAKEYSLAADSAGVQNTVDKCNRILTTLW